LLALVLQHQSGETLMLEGRGASYTAPTTISHLAELVLEHPDATLLAGGTDIGLLVTKQLKTLNHIIYLGDVAQLKAIKTEAGRLYIGAAVLLNQGYEAIVAEYPEATELWKRFASMPI